MTTKPAYPISLENMTTTSAYSISLETICHFSFQVLKKKYQKEKKAKIHYGCLCHPIKCIIKKEHSMSLHGE